ncbi:unnamed protein product [Rotaria sp. Silwood2]|nr:unnamed protein product [Rotaria sp. Silwood2]CAF4587687.1 unnamed protein product [Rotaria sp. Silwood2]
MSTGSKLENTKIQQSSSDGTTNGGSINNSETIKSNPPGQSMPFKMPHAPPHVYSCFVINQTGQPIECSLKYDGRPGEDKFDQTVNVTIPAHSEHYFPRQFFQPDLPESYCKWVKIVTHIRVKKSNGAILEVHYPFEHVQRPFRNWEFHVNDAGDILSMPPTRIANVLKYENLDQYEC